jgi:very-short-patch-repair endonuclease
MAPDSPFSTDTTTQSTTSSLATRLEASRQELLDLGLRNPLLNFRLSKAQGVAVVQEEAAEVYEVLVSQGKTMYFQAAPEPRKKALPAATTGLATESADEVALADEALPLPELTAEERQTSLTDNKLQTAEPLAKLESRLLNTYYTARTSLEEQGVNILYLALGMLTWYEAESSAEPRHAPLVLVPVLLERGTAAERFKLRYTGAEIESNLSLQAKLKANFGLLLPPLEEETTLPEYYAAVAAAVAGFPRWQVEPNRIALGFFSFSKFMLYRDLDPATWPSGATLLDHPAIEALLGTATGFRDEAPTVSDTAFLDTESTAHELHQVLDADSSQLLALLAVQEGRNLVVQGPPGTGKSQTIANLLAEAIGAGKKLLFVAEKMAALEVVKRRLDALGLGAACLELHSHKANKKALHDELRQTLSLGRPATVANVEDQMAQLPRYRQALNDYALAVNAPIGRSRRTSQQVAGELLRLAEESGLTELPRIAFPGLATWTDADAAHAEALAARLQATLQKIGLPKELLFWGSELTVLLPAEQVSLAAQLEAARAAVAHLQAAAQALVDRIGLPIPTERTAAERLLPAARHAQLAPPLLGAAVADAAWHQQASRLKEILAAGLAYNALRQQHEATLLPEAWDQQLLLERAALLAAGDKWWSFLSGDYRRARKRLQSLWRGPLPKEAREIITVIEAIHEAARHAKTLAEGSGLGQQLFGAGWQGERSDWPTLLKTQEYLTLTHQRIGRGELPDTLLAYLQHETRPSEIGAPLANLETTLAEHRTAVQAVVDTLQLNEARRFGPAGRLQFQPFETQQRTLAAWAADVPALRLTTEWNNVAATVQAEHLPELLLLAESWPQAPQLLATAVRQTWLEYLQRLAYEQHPALRQFERASHEETAARFRQADQDSLYHNRIRALRQHYEGLPHPQAGGQMLLLRNEFAKKTRHLPLRKLMQQAGRAVQAIKPVFMMSPLSVANYLPPGAVEFDLVVFDEASQVKPVDALGAIARGKQLVVVGDSKQLPPTSFFDSLTGSGEEADEENVTADIQSILELCKARQMPERMLRWHYRSLHQSLIAASNHLFYEDKLVIFPSPGGQGQLGLVYHQLPETYYERGTTRTNPLEAQVVAEAVLHHARTTPRLTLGVVAFSTAQRQAIQDALERLRRQHPETETFFNRHPHEPFFIKNLENVQGDERDVILISVGYGRTKDGYLTMSFGPLNGEGGERRLNVLITRAKQRCEVFTNLTADDLDLSRTRAKGVAALKTFLNFAQHGHLNQNEETGRAMESPFEEAVYRALTARGYSVRPQMGSQGFYIDLAVVDPNQPGRYVLGIECDGAMYHSARSARDRDRLRQQVLEAVGWRLHRIWSTDWLRDPQREMERVVQAIEEARRHAAQDDPNEPEEAEVGPEATDTGIEREAISAANQALAEPYQVAQLPAAVGHRELHQHSLGQLANWLTQIVRIESPIHLDEATRRLAQASGATQVGARMRKAGRDAALLATNLRHLRQQGDFLWDNTMQQPPLRDRSQLPAISRKLAFVAPEELARALRTVVEQSFALPRQAVFLPTVRLLGFSRLSDDMRQQLEPALTGLLERAEIEEVNGILRPV